MIRQGLRKATQCEGFCIWQRPSLWSREVLNIWVAAIDASADPDTQETRYHVEQLKFESAMRTWNEPQEEWREARMIFDWLCATLNHPEDVDDSD